MENFENNYKIDMYQLWVIFKKFLMIIFDISICIQYINFMRKSSPGLMNNG